MAAASLNRNATTSACAGQRPEWVVFVAPTLPQGPIWLVRPPAVMVVEDLGMLCVEDE